MILKTHLAAMPPIGTILIGAIFLATILLYLFFHKTTRGKGIYGEWKVARKLKRCFPRKTPIINNYICVDPDYNNVLSEKEKKTVQIDHIVVCEKGVLVIETKNYAGRLYGNDEQREWTQVLAGGKVKNALYNPIKQNATHCHHVRRIVGKEIPVKSIVVLLQDNTENLSCSENVIGLTDLRRYFSSLPDVADDDEISDAYQKLSVENAAGSISSRRHNRNVKRRGRDVARGICPRCGGALLPRYGENGPFRGCENYPKCRFTTKADR